MKDQFSVRITFSDSAKEFAELFIDFIEDNFDGLSIQKPRKGNNPKYQPGGKSYDPKQGEFTLAYSRLNIKKGEPQLPKYKGRSKIKDTN